MIDFNITMSDAMEVHCARGVAQWFKSHKLDFKAFLQDGISHDLIVSLDDAFGNRIAEIARKKRENYE